MLGLISLKQLTLAQEVENPYAIFGSTQRVLTKPTGVIKNVLHIGSKSDSMSAENQIAKHGESNRIMSSSKYLVESYRYGFNGMEKDDDASHGSYTAEFWQYSPAIGRRWNIDPVNKPYESPYSGFANNPVWFVDPHGNDTLNVHASKIESNGTVVFGLTFSIVKNGETKIVKHDLGDVYLVVYGEEYYKKGNDWAEENKDYEIRFEPYVGGSGKTYKNSIKIKYGKGGRRILVHTGVHSGVTLGCNLPSCSYDKLFKGGFGVDYIKTEKTQEVVDGIKKIYDENIPSEKKTDQFGRLIDSPKSGHNFLLIPNSVAREDLEDINIKKITPIDIVTREMNKVVDK